MRKVHIDEIKQGVKLAKAIFTADGKILLASGIEIKKSYIEKLKSYNITEIYIDDEISKNIEIPDVVYEKTRQEAKTLVKTLMDNYTLSEELDIENVKEIVNKIIEELLSNENILVNLSDIRSLDDYTFSHSVNVCILSLITGIGLGYRHSRLKELGIGAILHDIGKLKIPETILKKPSQLTVEEFEEIKRHPLYGYEILKKNPHVSIISAFIALGHHERYNGSGYPLQLKGDSIHDCARIVAVADVYDALSSDRVYRSKLRPHEVYQYVISQGNCHFDQKVINGFIKHVPAYPVGTGVILNSRERGIVVKNNKHKPTRPVIRVIYNSNNEKLTDYYEVDLSKDQNLSVVDACEI